MFMLDIIRYNHTYHHHYWQRGVQRMAGAGAPPPFPSADPACIPNAGLILGIQAEIASDCAWFPVHPPLRNVEYTILYNITLAY